MDAQLENKYGKLILYIPVVACGKITVYTKMEE